MNAVYFASPWFLAGLITLAIPFLLLLTKAKTLHVTSFSSILFLRNITEKASNVIEWKRFFLLMVRLLMLSALALAFALPFMNQHGRLFGGAETHLVFVMDRSYSMGYQEKGQSLLEASKQKVLELQKQHKKGKTWFSLYVFDEHLELVLSKSPDAKRFQEKIRDMKVSYQKTSFSNLLIELKGKISVEPQMKNQIFILSDFSIREAQIQKDFDAMASSWCEACRTQLVPVQPKAFSNFTVQSVSLPPRFLIPGQEEEIRAAYSASGMKGVQVKVGLWIDQQQVESQTITVSESQKGWLSFRAKFAAPGSYPFRVEAEEDALLADNARYGVAQVHEPLRVLLIQDRDYEYDFESPYFFFTQVLQSDPEAANARPWIHTAKTTAASLSGFKLEGYDLVIMADVARLEPKALTQLRYYLKNGGSLFFALGKNFEDSKDLNSSYFVQFLGGTFGAWLKAEDPSKKFFLESIQYQHPMLRIFEEGRKGDLRTVSFSKTIGLIPQEKTEHQVLLWFEGKRPALMEMKKEKGRLFFWASSLNDAWTDFPKNPLYVPFVFEWVKYGILRDQGSAQTVRIGERFKVHESAGMEIKPITVKNPKGEEITFYRDLSQGTQSMIAEMAGLYEWVDSHQEFSGKRWAVANVDPEESRPAYLSIQAAKEDTSSVKTSSSQGLSARFFIYRPLIYAVLGLLLMEAWLANKFYKPQWI